MSSLINITKIPLTLYIHIPWCIKKCPYCDFNSHTLPENDGNKTKVFGRTDPNTDYFSDYVTALIADVDSQLPFIQNRQISSIFIGGGTPSLLPIVQYKRLFKHLREALPFADGMEVTMEANPGTLEHAPFSEYLEVGINRLSLGVQSFADSKLKALGRIHDANQAIVAARSAREAGFKRINIDLMHGLPQQTLEDALKDIKLASHAGATHISWYQLTIEPNTVFYRKKPVLPDDEKLGEIEEQGSALLKSLGYNNYEVSAWVNESFEHKDQPCHHNVNYWRFGDYMAIGAGAHGKITIGNNWQVNTKFDSETQLREGIYRFSKSRLPKDYMSYDNYPKYVSLTAVADEALTGEFMLNALRLTQGVPVGLFSERTGLHEDTILPILDKLRDRGLLVNDLDIIQPTELGRRYLNTVLGYFI